MCTSVEVYQRLSALNRFLCQAPRRVNRKFKFFTESSFAGIVEDVIPDRLNQIYK